VNCWQAKESLHSSEPQLSIFREVVYTWLADSMIMSSVAVTVSEIVYSRICMYVGTLHLDFDSDLVYNVYVALLPTSNVIYYRLCSDTCPAV
jgi:hypothetical protein